MSVGGRKCFGKRVGDVGLCGRSLLCIGISHINVNKLERLFFKWWEFLAMNGSGRLYLHVPSRVNRESGHFKGDSTVNYTTLFPTGIPEITQKYFVIHFGSRKAFRYQRQQLSSQIVLIKFQFSLLHKSS